MKNNKEAITNKNEPKNTYSLERYRQIKKSTVSQPVPKSQKTISKSSKASKSKNKTSKKKKDDYKKNVIIISILLLVAILSLANIILTFIKPSISYQTVQYGTIDNGKIHKGVIVREEVVYNSEATGNIHYIVGEGQNIKKNSAVSIVMDHNADNGLKENLIEIDETLYEVQEKRMEVSDYQQHIYALEIEMNNLINSFYNSSNKATVYDFRHSIDDLLKDRTTIYAEDNTKFPTLHEDRQSLVNQLQIYQTPILSNEAGIVSYKIDGQEDLTTNISYNLYEEILLNETIPQKSVAEAIVNTPIFKIITDYTWQIVTYLDIEEANQFKQGQTYSLSIKEEQDETVLKTKIIEKTQEGDKVKLVLNLNEYLSNFLSSRVLNFSLGDTKATGLKIPLKSLVEKNVLKIPREFLVINGNQYGVLKADTEKFEPVDIQINGTDYVYIVQDITRKDSVQLNDSIISKEGNTFKVEEFDIVQGVYVINSRFADFKKVNVLLKNEDYAILSTDSETDLKEMDQIISNPKGIDENQLLKNMDIKNE
ncbi:hypothetical protein AN639_08875 [Candidatus Epulonipiscium fishelsonii]|uniref:Uncharacterized protein n=1 Tax=Candidatus Epulonipiscium fishelsonii TaxID=77094 RepID=A0ACC8XDJ2_9FIRM|nr:hypothetical protein AN639_08875 [Epulopiscium sp. SCG-B05WGA-EpuloA1]ONI40960.1 hypothetical protein AN396_04160 [Epulopiscium sp. SCG-B11WGA-EpuloA1]